VTQLHPGTRLRCTNSTTVVIITMGGQGALTCGGEPMIPATEAQSAGASPPAEPSEGSTRTLLGKRYRAPDGTLQVLCVRQGSGELALDGVSLELVKPKLLPASD
jgi:hypothetical protein